MTILDDNFWWQFLMTIFDDKFWWQFLLTILWQFLMTIFDDNVQIFETFSDFRNIFRFSEHFQIFGAFSGFWNIFRFLEHFHIFRTFSDFRKNRFLREQNSDFEKKIRFLENFQKVWDYQNFSRFLEFFLNCQKIVKLLKQELQMLSLSLFIQRSQSNCCSQLSAI